MARNYYQKRVKPKRRGRGPRIGTARDRNLIPLTMMSNEDLLGTKIRLREKNKVFAEIVKRGLSNESVEFRKN